jgi:hypothetical protein
MTLKFYEQFLASAHAFQVRAQVVLQVGYIYSTHKM